MTDLESLKRPFDPAVVKWRPGSKSGNRAMAMAYVDARDVMERLDEAFGVMGWSDSFMVVQDGAAVECTITVSLGDEVGRWVTKVDVGYPNSPGSDKEQEPLKAAYSDALKRAAVKFGIGRELYDTPSFWIPLNERGMFDESSRPVWIVGKGWMLPTGETSPPTPSSGSARAMITAKLKSIRIEGQPLTVAQAKAAVKIATGKESTSELSPAEVAGFLTTLDNQKFLDSLSEVVG
jgi:hypothetical protein